MGVVTGGVDDDEKVGGKNNLKVAIRLTTLYFIRNSVEP
jgi:hypothetical protein